jgi:hypothetical protein
VTAQGPSLPRKESLMAKKTETTHTTKRTAAGPSRTPVRKTKRG